MRSLSPVLAELAQHERYLALETHGRRYAVDVRYGLLTAQLALALSGQDRDEVLVDAVRAARAARSERSDNPPYDAHAADRDHHLRRSGACATARWTLSAARPLRQICWRSATALEAFRHASDNLYERVRACFFLYAIHRFHLPAKPGCPINGRIPFEGYLHLLERRFEEAIALFLKQQAEQGPSDTLSSALASAYHRLAFQTLADQVRRTVRTVRGNQWMFRIGHPSDQPLRIRPELLERDAQGAFPILRETTPVRMDLTHSAWSDIFFLGMDYPEGAQVLNVSIDLAVQGRDSAPRPPVEAYFRILDEPVLRLTSVDLATTADITELSEVFDFARDYLGLLKAALIASGLVPPGIEGLGAASARSAGAAGGAGARASS